MSSEIIVQHEASDAMMKVEGAKNISEKYDRDRQDSGSPCTGPHYHMRRSHVEPHCKSLIGRSQRPEYLHRRLTP